MANGQPPLEKVRVAVVGAGPCGLAATKTLIDAGLDVTCFEMSESIGGHWVYDNPNGRSAAYKSLTTNTTKHMSRFSDFEMPRDWPELPPHHLVREWFESYIDHFGFRDVIRTSHTVLSASPDENGWALRIKHDNREETLRFDALIAASGNYWADKVPDLPGHFDGECFHAHAYRSPNEPVDTIGKRVLVVGSGNTGCEIALELQQSGAVRVLMSARSGNWIMPKYVEGPDGKVPVARNAPLSHPTDTVPWFFRMLPRTLRESLFTRIAGVAMRRMFGGHVARLERGGLPPAPDNPLGKRPAIADGLADALESGVIEARGRITHIDGNKVTFDRGEAADIDVIICATGYSLEYPYLASEVMDTSHDDVSLYLGCMHPTHHNLFVVGVSRPTGAFWPIAEAQSKFIGELLSGSYRLPKQNRIGRLTGPILKRTAFNPALYGLTLREELARGRRRAKKQKTVSSTGRRYRNASDAQVV